MTICTIKLLKGFPNQYLKKNKLYDAHELEKEYVILSSPFWCWVPKEFCKYIGEGIKDIYLNKLKNKKETE